MASPVVSEKEKPGHPSATVQADGRWVEYDEYIDQQIRRTRGQVKGVEIAAALMVLTTGTLIFFLAMALADHWLFAHGLGFWGRFLALAVYLAGAGYYAFRRLLPLVLLRINPIYAAETIERSKPSLKNGLINFLLLRSQREQVPTAVYQAVEQQAATSLSRVPMESAVDRSRLIHLGYMLLAIVALFSLYFVFSPKNPLATVGRVMLPWAKIDAPTRVAIVDVQPGDRTFFRGETVEVSAELHGIVGDEPVQIFYSTADRQAVDQPVTMYVSPKGLRHTAKLPNGVGGLQQDIDYRIEAGDAISATYHLQSAIAPTIAVDSIEYEYPTYTERGHRQVDSAGDIQALEGTKVVIHAHANQAIRSAEIELEGEKGLRKLPAKIDGQKVTASFTLALDEEDRTRPQFAHYRLRPEGREKPQPVQYRIDVIPDIAPEIKFLAPEKEETTVPANGRLTLEIRSLDPDYALSEVKLLGEMNRQNVLDKRLLNETHSGPLMSRFVFDPAKLGLKVGDTVEYWGMAKDNRTPTPNETQTARRMIRIGSPDLRRRPSDQLAQNDPKNGGQAGTEQNPDDQNSGDNNAQQNSDNHRQPKSRDGGSNSGNNNDKQDPHRDRSNNKNPPNDRDQYPNTERNPADQQKPDDAHDKQQGGSQQKQNGKDPKSGDKQSQPGNDGQSDQSKADQQNQKNSDQKNSGAGKSGDPSAGEQGGSSAGQSKSDSPQNGKSKPGDSSNDKSNSSDPSDSVNQTNSGNNKGQGNNGQSNDDKSNPGADGANQDSAAQKNSAQDKQGNKQGNSGDDQAGQKPWDSSSDGQPSGKSKNQTPAGGAPPRSDQPVPNDGSDDGQALKRIAEFRQKHDDQGGSADKRLGKSQQRAGAQPDSGQKSDPANKTGKPGDQQKSDSASGNKTSDKPQSGNKSGDQSQSGNKPGERSNSDNSQDGQNPAGQQPGPDSSNPSGEKPGDKSTGDKSADKNPGPDKTGLPAGAKSGDKTGDKAGEKSGDKAGDKATGDKTGAEKTNGENATDKPGADEHGADKPGAGDKPGDKQSDDPNAGGQKPGDKPNGDASAQNKPDDHGKQGGNGEANPQQNKQDPNSAQNPSQSAEKSPGGGQKPSGDQPQGSKPSDQNPDAAKGAGHGQEPKKETEQNDDNPNSTGKGDQAKSGSQPTDKKSQNDTPKEDHPEAKGGDPEGLKGNSGAGDSSGTDDKGSASTQEGNRPRENKQDNAGAAPPKESEAKSDEAKSPSNSPHESNSKGGEGGDKSGGGKAGPGQSSNQAGTGGAGHNTASQEGSGKAEGQGHGETSSKAGTDKTSDRPTGQSGDKAGNGSQTKAPKPGEKNANPAAPKSADTAGTPSSKSPNGTPSPNGKDPGNSGGATNIPQGGDRAGPIPETADYAGRNTGDAANPEFARKQFDLALDYLKKGNPDLLKELHWSSDDAQRLAARLEQMKKNAQAAGPQGDEARREMNDLLRTLGSRGGLLSRHSDQPVDTQRGLRESHDSGPPAEYIEQFDAFQQGALRGGK
jgi:hypothetical protein